MAWYNILGGLAAPVVDYLKQREALKSAERVKRLELDDALHRRKIELLSQGLVADATWEMAQIENSGWKDEYVLFVISIPLIGCFIPGLSPYMLRGFEVLGSTPSWYQLLVLSVFFAVYGIRYWRREQSDT